MIARILLLVTVALAVAACGADKRHAATHSEASAGGLKPCRLTKAQRRSITSAEADIRRLKKIQAPLHTYTEMGTPAQERVTGQFLLDMGRAELPINERARLIRLAKGAVGLCGQCFQGLEAAEPAVSGGHFGGQPRCG